MLTDELPYGVATVDGENDYVPTLIAAMRLADTKTSLGEPAWVRHVSSNEILYYGKERLDVK